MCKSDCREPLQRLRESGLQQPRAHQQAAEHHAEQGRTDDAHLEPRVGRHQALRRHQFGQQTELGRRISGRADADDGHAEHRMRAEQQADHAEHLDGVHQRHDTGLRQRVGECADEGGQGDVRDGEAELEDGSPPAWQVALLKQQDGDDEQRVVGQGRGELRGDEAAEVGGPGVAVNGVGRHRSSSINAR